MAGNRLSRGPRHGQRADVQSERKKLNRHAAAVLDQGLYSVSNFALNIALARWLSESEYGAFSSSYAYFLLLSLVHGALLVEPMTVFGGQHYREAMDAYFAAVRRLHGGLSALLILVTGIACLALWVLGQELLVAGMLGVGVSLWAVLLFYLYRRLCYVLDQTWTAATSGIVYLGSLLLMTFVLFQKDRLSILSAYGAVTAAALLAAGFLHLRVKASGGSHSLSRRTVLEQHYRYGRWSMGAAIFIWLPANVYYLLIPRAVGLQAAGVLKAFMNLAQPMIQANMAIANTLLASLARVSHDPSAFRSQFRRFTTWVSIACLGYWLTLSIFGRPLVSLLYDGRYLDDVGLVWLVGLIPLVTGLALAERSACQASLKPEVVFVANAIGALVATIVGIIMVAQFGLRGALITMIMSYATMFLWLRLHPQRPNQLRS